MRILQIGCGTGSSTVAFAEQGADVVGLDIDDRALAVAQQRLELYGLTEAQLLHGNALDHAVASEKSFDLIMFFASLEHMLHSGRLEALRRMWAALGRGPRPQRIFVTGRCGRSPSCS